MSDFLNDSAADLRRKIADAQLACDKLIEENDKAIGWASNEISFYRNLLAYAFRSLIGKPIYWASPEWKKVETHTITEVRIEKQPDGFFGEDYNGEMVVKLFVDNDDSYFIAEKLGETLFLTWDEATKIAGTGTNKK